MQRLLEASDANAFISHGGPQATKEMWNALQSFHPKTHSAFWILETCTSKYYPEIIDRDLMEEIMECWNRSTQLHLKIVVYHAYAIRAGDAIPIELLELKTVLMPRQWLLYKLDPDCELPVPQLLERLEPNVLEYRALVVMDRVEPCMKVKKALRINKKWNLLSRAPTWVAIPFACACAVCFPNYVVNVR